MRIVISGNPETQTIIVTASENGTVVYADEHSPEETLRSVLDKVRYFVGVKPFTGK
jgi:hypothetical protein